MRKGLVWLLGGFAPLCMWVACGGDAVTIDGGGQDATTNPDTGVIDDSGSTMDTGVMDDGSMMMDGGGGGDSATDGGGGGLKYLCPDAGSVNDCSQCANRPRPCVNCAIDGGTYVAYCVTSQTSCFPQGNGLQRCPCADAGSCAAPYQVCQDVGQGAACRTCGETQTLGDVCKGGGMCRADGGCN